MAAKAQSLASPMGYLDWIERVLDAMKSLFKFSNRVKADASSFHHNDPEIALKQKEKEHPDAIGRLATNPLLQIMRRPAVNFTPVQLTLWNKCEE